MADEVIDLTGPPTHYLGGQIPFYGSDAEFEKADRALRIPLPPTPIKIPYRPPVPNERDRFEAAIDEAIAAGRPADLANARQVYADWLDERNTEADGRLAAAQRWMAANGKWPEPPNDGSPGRWDWYAESMYPDAEEYRRHLLPDPVFWGSGLAAPFPTRPDAERALAEALAAAPVDAAG